MKKRNARLTLGLVKSTYTGTIYLTLLEDASPIKFWPYSALNKAGIDVLSIRRMLASWLCSDLFRDSTSK